MCYRRRTDCPVASLLAMTCSNLLPVHIIPGHCRYAAGKAPLPTCRAPPPCNRTHTPAFCMPLHPTPLQPQTRSIFLHVIANQCAHWCGNPRPRRESWQPGTTSGKSAAFPYSPKVFPFAMCYRRRTDCPVASLLAMTCNNLLPVPIITRALPVCCRKSRGEGYGICIAGVRGSLLLAAENPTCKACWHMVL